MLCFKLSMPVVNSWNGKWTGANQCHALIRGEGRTKEFKEHTRKILEKKYFLHRFDDGWVARIEVSQVDKKEAMRIKRESVGFCGYDWMVDSIMDLGEIKWKGV
jgi:hypothetical protein